MFYQQKYQKRAHDEIEFIFRVLLPKNGLHVRREQIRLCHEMLDALLGKHIALCDAGVGIGKTYAYLVACVVMRKHNKVFRNESLYGRESIVISTSSIALQRAVTKEYIPFLSQVLLENKIIKTPLRAVIRKGKEHFVCSFRLKQRLEAVQGKKKNREQLNALHSLEHQYDMDEVTGLSGFDRRMVCVPKFCSFECPQRMECAYQRYLKRAKSSEIFIQICNHNYLLADAMHRSKGYRPLLNDYQALIVDEAHQLPDAASQMYGQELAWNDIQELCELLEQEYQGKNAKRIKRSYWELLDYLKDAYPMEKGERCHFHSSSECQYLIDAVIQYLSGTARELNKPLTRWVKNRLEEAAGILQYFYRYDSEYILYLRLDKANQPVFCAACRKTPEILYDTLWDQGFPAILTSGTLKAGTSFGRTKRVSGLYGINRVRVCTAQSPFHYERNCLLYLPGNTERVKRGSQKEMTVLADQIRSLICATYGHTLVLFTSYSQMGSIYQILKDQLPYPLVEVWRHTQDEIARFKTLENAVLFAAGSCWEGVDFPGDMVSSLIIVRLPFAVPDPIREAERDSYKTLEDYIQEIIIPDMQKKLRQGFGRAIRTEEDTCVVSILDTRAVEGGKYHQSVLEALPNCQVTDSIHDVEMFIHRRKSIEYYM